jgi:outer membrane immunogenic protein
MRAKLLAALLAAFVIPAALAGELPGRGKIVAPAKADEAPQWNRPGMYVGILGGYDVAVLSAEGFDLANGKLNGTGVLGWNWRVAPNIVFGVEGDWTFTGISGATGEDDFVLKASTNHILTLRGRAGMTAGPALLYLTGGAAWQSVRLTAGGGDEVASEREWQFGYVAGGGAEVELSRGLAVRLEALHYIFPEDGAPLSSVLDSEHQHTMVRAGVIFKLN